MLDHVLGLASTKAMGGGGGGPGSRLRYSFALSAWWRGLFVSLAGGFVFLDMPNRRLCGARVGGKKRQGKASDRSVKEQWRCVGAAGPLRIVRHQSMRENERAACSATMRRDPAGHACNGYGVMRYDGAYGNATLDGFHALLGGRGTAGESMMGREGHVACGMWHERGGGR